MTMHLIKGVQVHGKSKKKAKKLTQKDLERLTTEWRQHNKNMRRKHMHDLQFDTVEDYIAYTRGQYKPKSKKKEFVEYEAPKSNVRDTPHYPSLSTSDAIPESCARKESPKYTGDLLVGIGVMHKSNAVPIMRGTSQAEDIAKMRRN